MLDTGFSMLDTRYWLLVAGIINEKWKKIIHILFKICLLIDIWDLLFEICDLFVFFSPVRAGWIL
jgi:hypothetical protein